MRAAVVVSVLLGVPGAWGQCVPTWTSPAGGVIGFGGSTLTWAPALHAFDGDGGGPQAPALYAGGTFHLAGQVPVRRVARWDGWRWYPVGSGVGLLNDQVLALAGVPLGTVPHPGVYVGGILGQAGNVPVIGLAHWNGEDWRDAGGGMNGYVLGLRWLGEDAPPLLRNRLFVGGYFTQIGGLSTGGVATWDGSSWSALGSGLTAFIPGPGQAPGGREFALFDDDGPGPREAGLYIGGNFGTAGGIASARCIARWDGQAWEALGAGVNSNVDALAVFDADGPGPEREMLYVGGDFTVAGGLTARGLARWDGQAWSTVPGWTSGIPFDMAVFDDDGPGPNRPALFVAGAIGQVGGVPAGRIAKWDGVVWTFLEGGVSGWGQFSDIEALAVFDEDGPGPNPGGLYVGGLFTHAGATPSNGIARWGCPLAARCEPDCDGDGALTLADLTCFVARFAKADPAADCNADGFLNLADFGCFQTKFAVGCP